MLDHLHVEHHVEALALGQQRLGRGGAVVDGKPCWAAWARAVPIFLSEASTPVTAKPSRAMGSDKQAPAAADIQQPQALEGPQDRPSRPKGREPRSG